MTAKLLLFGEDAHVKMLAGMKQLTDAVRITLGPKARTVVLGRSYGSPTIINSGVMVAREIELADPFENMGAQMMKEVASKTSDIARGRHKCGNTAGACTRTRKSNAPEHRCHWSVNLLMNQPGGHSMGKPVNIGVAAKIGKYSDAVEIAAGARQLHISGTPGIRKDGSVPESFEEQADLAWKNLIEILEAANMGVGNLIKINQYVVRAEDIAAYPAIRLKHLGEHRPASMLAVVSLLVKADILFEVEAIASD